MSEEKLCVDLLNLHKLLDVPANRKLLGLPADVRIKRVAIEPATRISKTVDMPLGKYRRESCDALAVYIERIDDG